MIDRLVILLLAACAGFAGLLAWELAPAGADAPAAPRTASGAASEAKPQSPEAKAADLAAIAHAAPLFSATRRPPAAADKQATPELPNVRLSGIVIEGDSRLAIFAAATPGAKPLIRAEGEMLDGWRLDSISPDAVSLRGPGGNHTLQPKPDLNLVRRAILPPAAAQPKPAQTPASPAGAGRDATHGAAMPPHQPRSP